ncbi:uncharacterized protein TC_0305-like isoform X2 [Babylonia areolata]|uniref:uncharacterized protein TC_0305-like isoform X2 n=1 Tax=Babylonia areolata TaxID=304850 RepID=UPI003FD2742D
MLRANHLQKMATHASLWTAVRTRRGPLMGHLQRRHSSHRSSAADDAVVFLYRGPGTTSSGYNHMHHSLSRCLDHTVLPIGPDDIIEGQWRDKCAAIVFGGGYADGFVRALGGQGARRIKDYVSNGGTYVGVCAGAYLASQLVVFQQKGQPGMLRKRPLKFFPGKCVGPVDSDYHPAHPPHLHHPLHPVSFILGRRDVTGGCDVIGLPYVITVNAYVHGGGVFLPHGRWSDFGSAVNVLAYYESEGKESAAVVVCQVGRGVAVLSSPHLEMTSFADDVVGEMCWRGVLREGGLRTLCPISFRANNTDADNVTVDAVEFG